MKKVMLALLCCAYSMVAFSQTLYLDSIYTSANGSFLASSKLNYDNNNKLISIFETSLEDDETISLSDLKIFQNFAGVNDSLILAEVLPDGTIIENLKATYERISDTKILLKLYGYDEDLGKSILYADGFITYDSKGQPIEVYYVYVDEPGQDDQRVNIYYNDFGEIDSTITVNISASTEEEEITFVTRNLYENNLLKESKSFFGDFLLDSIVYEAYQNDQPVLYKSYSLDFFTGEVSLSSIDSIVLNTDGTVDERYFIDLFFGEAEMEKYTYEEGSFIISALPELGSAIDQFRVALGIFSGEPSILPLGFHEGKKLTSIETFTGTDISDLILSSTSTYFYREVLNSSSSEIKINPVAVFPNPTTDWLQLDDASDYVYYQVFDGSGKSVMSRSVDNEKIDVTNLPTGTYRLLLHSKSNNNLSVTSFIKL